MPGKKIIPTEKQRIFIIDHYNAGDSTYKIGKALGFREDKIQFWLAKWSVPRRPVGFQKGQQSPRYKGFSHHNGYKIVYAKGHPNADKYGKIPEHRLIMSQLLGRPLSKDEVVHHNNETNDKTNNDPTKLQLMTNAEHTSHHWQQFSPEERSAIMKIVSAARWGSTKI